MIHRIYAPTIVFTWAVLYTRLHATLP